jgi:hypothetical protein
MKIEALKVLSCFYLAGTSGTLERKAPAYPLTMHNTIKQIHNGRERLQHKF